MVAVVAVVEAQALDERMCCRSSVVEVGEVAVHSRRLQGNTILA